MATETPVIVNMAAEEAPSVRAFVKGILVVSLGCHRAPRTNTHGVEVQITSLLELLLWKQNEQRHQSPTSSQGIRPK